MPTLKKKNPGQPKDTYFDRVKAFPLKTIKNDREHKAAVEILGDLMGTEMEMGTGDYVDTLIVLITKYEDEHHEIDDEMTPQEAVRALMQANQLSQADIGEVINSESTVSMFLKGDRSLSKEQIKRLAERFKVSTDLFM